MKWYFGVLASFMLFFTCAVKAGSYVCPKGETLSWDNRRCSGGGIPLYIAKQIVPSTSSHQSLVNSGSVQYFFRGWALFVPGVAYTVPSHLDNYENIIISADTGILHRLQINQDGTFKWDGWKGRWIFTGEGMDGYPILLVNAYEGRSWRVGVNVQGGGIYLRDGYTWFQAKE